MQVLLLLTKLLLMVQVEEAHRMDNSIYLVKLEEEVIVIKILKVLVLI